MDNRDFESVEQMNEVMIEKWNKKVHARDEVVILGDLSLGNGKETNEILCRLKGRLCLIRGNHDERYLRDKDFDVSRFEWVKDYTEIHDINRTAELCEQSSMEETEYHAIWSNQCIELWFLLHFSYFQSDIHRKEYWPKLSECMTLYGLGTYSKGREDMYSILKPYMDIAIRNARKLDAINQGRTPAMSAPGTKVYELIEKLKPYLKG